MPVGQYERYPGLNDGLDIAVERRCSKCRVVKPIGAYSPDRRNRADGVQSICKECRRRRAVEWRAKNPEEAARRSRENYLKFKVRRYANGLEWRKKNRARVREYALIGRYGITAADQARLIAKQGDTCAICRLPFKGRPHTDHDHRTGRVRGILCGGCNIGVGFHEKPGFSVAVRAYLKVHATDHVVGGSG